MSEDADEESMTSDELRQEIEDENHHEATDSEDDLGEIVSIYNIVKTEQRDDDFE
jgi:hypothetical protein